MQLIVHWFCQQKCRIYLSLGTGRVEAGTESEGECPAVLFNNDDIFFLVMIVIFLLLILLMINYYCF